MWNSLCNYLYDKFFSKPTVGQKRKNSEWTEYHHPIKQMRLDTSNKFCTGSSSYESINDMKRENNMYEDDEDECCITSEIFHKKWTSSSTMARQPIHRTDYNFRPSVSLYKNKKKPESSNKIIEQPIQSNNMDDIEVVKIVNKNSVQNSGKILKNKSTSDRINNSYQSSSTSQNTDKLRPAFQNKIKKGLNFLQENYRLSEKIQYMQLLQQHTTKLNTLLASFAIQRIGSPKGCKSSIPIIDLTKEKSDVVINRSRENIPWTSSRSKSNDDVNILDSGAEGRQFGKINSLQDLLKTHPVTEKHLVDEILSRHSTETAEKRRRAEIEAAKLEVLTNFNRKAYSDALEEKMRNYMRITAPVLEEIQPTKDKYVLPQLTKEQEAKVNSLLTLHPPGEILVEKFGLQIKRRDMQTLKGLNWLNDEVINFYMNLIMERGKQGKLPSVYAFNTFFYPKLVAGGHSSLKRWTKKVDIFSHDMILVPVHLGMHWCLALIDFRSKEVRYYDSMGSSNSRCLQALLSYLEAESLDKKKQSYSTKDWEQINVSDIPQQMNGSDCGVFSCMFAEHLSRDCPLQFSQEQMPYFRRKMVLEIAEVKLLT